MPASGPSSTGERGGQLSEGFEGDLFRGGAWVPNPEVHAEPGGAK